MSPLGRALRRTGVTALVASGALAIGGGVGTAYAWFSSHGSGSGTGSMGSISITLTTAATPTAAMLPGTPGDMTFKIQNNSKSSVNLSHVALTNGQQPSTTKTGCSTSDSSALLSLNTSTIAQDIQALGQVATVGSQQVASFDLAGAVTMSSKVTNPCQGASFSIPVTVTVTKG